jgi:predicted Zn-dependent protease
MAFSEDEKGDFKIASELYKNGKVEEALPILQELANQHPESGVLSATLANAYWDLEMFDQALHSFRTAITNAPASEKISLGYFHLLWFLNKRDEAVAEIRRFRENAALSDHYLEIVDEVKEKTDYEI